MQGLDFAINLAIYTMFYICCASICFIFWSRIFVLFILMFYLSSDNWVATAYDTFFFKYKYLIVLTN